ncbi:MAG: NTP transferase domain-containing protein [Chloroflexi bacterium]|nr:NTP transferase domain-containing protein [Chloroflexota bacterium]
MTDSNTYALIMAGGAGTRLWPLSRQERPKPLLSLVEAERSMYQIAVERLHPLLTPDRIFVVANEQLSLLLQEQVVDIPPENYIIEPIGRDTAPAVGLGAIHIRDRNPSAIMAVLTADHYITDIPRFHQVLQAAIEMAQRGNIVTLGITPTYPATGYGYIQSGPLMEQMGDLSVYEVTRFWEKPNSETAQEFIESGAYSWNSGMFIWPVQRVMGEFERHAPELNAVLNDLAGKIGHADYDRVFNRVWPKLNRISVDYALMEHIREKLCVIPAKIGWTDIGDFSTLYDILSDGTTNQNVFSGQEPVLIDTNGSLIYSTRMVATIGVEDLVIIDTDDVLLVCRRDRVQDVKKLVNSLKESQRKEHL